MSRINVDHQAALRTLENAAALARQKGYVPASRFKAHIAGIVTGTHLTYRYILVTGLLAKATDERANPLSLQAGADLDGAYDARSLCHSVVVAHEARLLDNGLGGSNEPYLNKPARFPKIDLSNAVRQGNDKRTLQVLHEVLSRIKTRADGREALQDAVHYAVQRVARDAAALKGAVATLVGGANEIRSYVHRLIAQSHHGETALLATAGLLWLMGITRGEKWTISVHPSNESGSSSNQIGDIDVWLGSQLVLTAEVKDKVFTAKDVDHAAGRVRRENFHRLHFVEGPRANLIGETRPVVQADASKGGVDVQFLTLSNWADVVTAFAPPETTLREFAEAIASFAREARAKDETLVYLRDLAVQI
jgi:hypothetical protein